MGRQPLRTGESVGQFQIWPVAFALVLILLALLPVESAVAKPHGGGTGNDLAGEAFNVLPPGQAGSLFPGVNSVDQIPLYDDLTPKFDSVTDQDLPKYFKPNIFGLGGLNPQETELPAARPGLRIERDRYDVPHVFADSRVDVMFGAGWVATEDRSVLMEALRGPGRIAALDVPGVDASAAAGAFRSFTPTPETEQFLSSQASLLQQRGPDGERVITDIDNYLAGINAFLAQFSPGTPRWTRNDVISVSAFIGSILGKGGGDEARRSELLSALEQRLGLDRGSALWNDLREHNDAETPVTIDHKFRYEALPQHPRGNAVLDDASLDNEAVHASAVDQASRRRASNALLLSANRSRNGHPLFVAGPQTGYFYPEILMEQDLHGGGVDARGAVFPGSGPYVELGRGPDFAWSATSAGSDIVDQYVERLCGNDTTYLYKGECRAMATFNAGVLGAGGGNPQQTLSFKETVHGPVIGYAKVNGERVAISQKRSTRGREVMSAIGFSELNSNEVDSPKTFFRAVSKIEQTFNWFYADDKDIAVFSSGLLPVRPPFVDPGLPTWGTGEFEWRKFLKPSRHPQDVNPKSGVLANWNNRPAPDFGASDSNWTYGSIQRVQLLQDAIERQDTHTLGSVVAAMNRAGTEDLRVMRVLPSIASVLKTGPAPTQRAARSLQLLEDWRTAGGSRLDVDLNGKIDNPGAAIMDAAWPKIADAVMAPALGPQIGQLAGLIPRDENARSLGSAYQTGWYGYVDKDLRTLLGGQVDDRFDTRFCGGGDLAACRNALWGALDAAAAGLAAVQGPDPETWRASALGERIRFAPGLFLPATMRWTNRPTFQQVIWFASHR